MANTKYDTLMACAENNKKELQTELTKAVSELLASASAVQCKLVYDENHAEVSTDMIHKNLRKIDEIKVKLIALDNILGIKESIESGKKKLYWYTYRLRGFSLGAQPKDFIVNDERIGRFGAIIYERELTKKEMSDYELDLHKIEMVDATSWRVDS
ncbi:hypothetical protein [Bacillus cereus group sp. BfR-BA-00999]|uniref:defense against restriction DarA-related protein n=1 Tax=Bacillus cereus group sp. BfR-BA-00999 TaxID=3094871 RepID=UPI0029C3049D|nr:hypothetical protein [Bacillus cereus group sp. BfR-BA-00999]MDX5885012.1 hypothetical protein [Bacillus cereus group sp. BfR-BA-00999]